MTQRVTLLSRFLGPKGGLEKATLHLGQAFAARGCTVSYLNTKASLSEEEAHGNIITFPSSSLLGYRRLIDFDRDCKQWLKENPQDIVFGMDRNTAQTHYRAGNGCHAAFLDRRREQESWIKNLSFKLNPLHRNLLAMEKAAFESSALRILFTNSNLVKEEILNYYDTEPDKIHVVHNGVQWKEYETAFQNWELAKADFLASHQFPKDHFHFIFVGSGWERKGLAQVMEGLALLPRKDWTLLVVGKDKNVSRYHGLAGTLNIEKNVYFLGEQRDVIPYYQMADALVIPSLYDPFANVTVEALAMGLHVISSRENGGHEVLSKETGTIIPDVYSPEKVCSSLLRAMKFPKELSRAYKTRASVEALDYSTQLDAMVEDSLATGGHVTC